MRACNTATNGVTNELSLLPDQTCYAAIPSTPTTHGDANAHSSSEPMHPQPEDPLINTGMIEFEQVPRSFFEDDLNQLDEMYSRLKWKQGSIIKVACPLSNQDMVGIIRLVTPHSEGESPMDDILIICYYDEKTDLRRVIHYERHQKELGPLEHQEHEVAIGKLKELVKITSSRKPSNGFDAMWQRYEKYSKSELMDVFIGRDKWVEGCKIMFFHRKRWICGSITKIKRNPRARMDLDPELASKRDLITITYYKESSKGIKTKTTKKFRGELDIQPVTSYDQQACGEYDRLNPSLSRDPCSSGSNRINNIDLARTE